MNNAKILIALSLILSACSVSDPYDQEYESGDEVSSGTGESGIDQDLPGPDYDLECQPGESMVVEVGPGICTSCLCGEAGILIECDSPPEPCGFGRELADH